MNSNYSIQKNKIISFYKNYKRMPGYKEIMSILGFKSKNSVYKLIEKMVVDGTVDKDSKGKITPKNLSEDLPMLGVVEAGIPTMVDVNHFDNINISDYLVRNRESTYILEVKGDSMIDEGIFEGDLVIAERRGEPKDGDIVIAEVDGGWTMKYYKKKDGKVYLLPANKNYRPIYPQYELKVAAIVRGVIRKY